MKKPPQSVKDINADIKNEISRALEILGADRQLLAIVGSWGDTLSHREILRLLREWNASAAREKGLDGRG